MVDTFIAVAAIAGVVFTASVLIRFRRRPFPYGRFLLALALGAVIVSIIFPVYVHSNRGAPLNLLVITCLCFCVSCLVPLTRSAWSLALFLTTLVLAVGLPWFANAQEGYTFWPSPRERKSDRLVDALQRLPRQEQSYPAGWLADQPFALEIPRENMRGRIYLPHPRWHSRFTGMYRLEVVEGEAWFRGGQPGARGNIEIRSR